MSVGGLWGTVLHIDLDSQEATAAEIPCCFQTGFLGARGLAARYYWDLVDPGGDPFSPNNALILFCGPLTGTRVPCSAKTGLATKSPMTRRYTCSNAGGNFGPRLKAAGFDGLVLTGTAPRPMVIAIRDRGVQFIDADSLWGMGIGETMREVKRLVGLPSVSVACIGPAGERLVTFACVQADSRSFGRGGAGAVMGSKNVKAIAVSGTGSVPVADPRVLSGTAPALTRRVGQARADLHELGTGQLTEVMNSMGCYPTRNFRTSFFDEANGIGASHMKRRYWIRNTTCFRCPIACGKLCAVSSGSFEGSRAEPEYESIWALGPQCGVGDFGAIVKALQSCDTLGLDAMTAGYLAGMCMDLYEDRLIDADRAGGLDLRFGDGQAVVALVEAMGTREGLGEELAQGLLEVLESNPEWVPYAMHVKGLPFAGYDPRAFHGIGLTYGTSSRGACHNVGGWTISDELMSGRYDRYAVEGKGKLVKALQDVRAFVDSLGVCTNARRPLGFTDTPNEVVLKAVTGMNLSAELLTIGERVYNLERLLLVREGVRRSDDLLPPRMSEPLMSGPAAGHSLPPDKYAVMLDEYYSARGWDPDGVPRPETSERLGLRSLATQRPCR